MAKLDLQAVISKVPILASERELLDMHWLSQCNVDTSST